MELVRSALAIDEEATLAARAAWLYFAGGQTQAKVAGQLNVPSSKAHRLIAKATRDGLIRVFVEGPIAGCIALEEALKDHYDLGCCEVVPTIDDGPLPLKTLGTAGARYLRNVLDRKDHRIIAIGHGRTLAAAIDFLPSRPAEGVKFVSLLGGLTRRFAANPFDVIHRLAERTGAEAYLMPVPFFANSVADKQVLLSQMGVRDVVALSEQATLAIVGIGEITHQGFIAGSGLISRRELEEVAAAGAAGEMLGYFFGDAGQLIAADLSERALAPDIVRIKDRKIVAIAGGEQKIRAVRAILNSGLLFGLITDEATAHSLAEDAPDKKSGNDKNGQTAKA